MTQEIEDLATFVNRVMIEKNLSTYTVASRSGGGISQGMVSKVRNGDVLSPSLPKLKGLAKGLDVPLQMVLDAAGKTPQTILRISNERFAAMSLRFDGMSDAKKTKALLLIEMMERELDRIAQAKK